MIRKLISTIKFFYIQIERGFDHLHRRYYGLPTMKYSQITPTLYVGGQYTLRAVKTLKKRGVTGVVNMRMRSIHKETDTNLSWLSILNLPTPDLTAPRIEDLQKGVKFIRKQIDAGGKVYVHCRAGEGRGPTMGLAFLISEGMTLEDALKLVQKTRTFARPTTPQMKQLKVFEDLMEKQRQEKSPVATSSV